MLASPDPADPTTRPTSRSRQIAKQYAGIGTTYNASVNDPNKLTVKVNATTSTTDDGSAGSPCAEPFRRAYWTNVTAREANITSFFAGLGVVGSHDRRQRPRGLDASRAPRAACVRSCWSTPARSRACARRFRALQRPVALSPVTGARRSGAGTAPNMPQNNAFVRFGRASAAAPARRTTRAAPT